MEWRTWEPQVEEEFEEEPVGGEEELSEEWLPPSEGIPSGVEEWELKDAYKRRMQREARIIGAPEPSTYEEAKEFEKARRKREKALKEWEKLEELHRKAKRAEYEAMIREFSRRARPVPQVGKLIGKFKTKPKESLIKVYFPKYRKEEYVPPPVGGFPMGTASPIGKVTIPNLGRLSRQVDFPKIGKFPIGLQKSSELELIFSRFRKLGSPILPPREQTALTELRINGNWGTLKEIVSRLEQLGVPRQEAIKAIRGLLKKGLIRKIYEGKGEKAVYEVNG